MKKLFNILGVLSCLIFSSEISASPAAAIVAASSAAGSAESNVKHNSSPSGLESVSISKEEDGLYTIQYCKGAFAEKDQRWLCVNEYPRENWHIKDIQHKYLTVSNFVKAKYNGDLINYNVNTYSKVIIFKYKINRPQDNFGKGKGF